MKVIPVIVIVYCLFLTGCVSTPLVLPDGLKTIDINADCSDEARVVGIDIKAILEKDNDTNWLIIRWVPRYYSHKEPAVDLIAGLATYVGQENNVYYYKCNLIPNGKKIGRIIIPKATDKYGPESTVIEVFRRSDSPCLELREIKKF